MREMSTPEILNEASDVQKEVERKYQEGGFEEFRKRIFQPFTQTNYQREKVEESRGEYKYSFSKIEMEERDKEILMNYIRRFENAVNDKNPFKDPANWIAISQLDYSIENVKIDIFDSALKGYKILFCPNSEIKTGTIFYDDKTIFVAGDLASIGGLSIVLHEKGHIKDSINRIGKPMFPSGGTSSEDVEAEQLRKEREASMYALSKMWRILRKHPQLKSDVLLYLKDMAYYSYCDSAFSNLQKARNMEAAMADFAGDLDVEEQELDEQNNISMWLNFKDSSEYAEWKKLEKFVKLDEFDEYGAWKEWAIETGRLYDEEFHKIFLT